MSEIFYIPEGNNKITPNDISVGKLRITAGNKSHFPTEDCDVTFSVNNTEYICHFRLNSNERDRSYTIINKSMLQELNIEPSDILECQRVGEKAYKLSK